LKYITIYTKEEGRLEFTWDEWMSYDESAIVLHREDGPAIEYRGYKAWFRNNALHRVDGPAVCVDNGYKAWFINNVLHRLDGPATEYANGDKRWFIDNELLLPSDFDRIIEEVKQLSPELKLTDPRWWVREMK
jgi:hypothetical protein